MNIHRRNKYSSRIARKHFEEASKDESKLRNFWVEKWLDAQGGRCMLDVIENDGDPYVVMYGMGDVEDRVYIPSTESIIVFFETKYETHV